MTRRDILNGLEQLIRSHEPCSHTHQCSVVVEMKNLANAIRKNIGSGEPLDVEKYYDTTSGGQQ